MVVPDVEVLLLFLEKYIPNKIRTPTKDNMLRIEAMLFI
jgi:hypothetical protein